MFFIKGILRIFVSMIGAFVGMCSLIEEIGRNPHEDYSAEWIAREKELKRR